MMISLPIQSDWTFSSLLAWSRREPHHAIFNQQSQVIVVRVVANAAI